VLATEGIYLWLGTPDGPPFTGLARTYERVEPFFEPGRTYTRYTEWSIPAQQKGVTERFDCTVVERNGDGKRVAFGRLTVKGQNVDQWITMSRYNYNQEGWQVT
jgi:hypothetical protein